MLERLFAFVLVSFQLQVAGAFSAIDGGGNPSTPRRVVLSGAGGQTGQLLFQKLLARPDEFQPLGLVRTEESKNKLVESGVPPGCIAVVDITDAEALKCLSVGKTTEQQPQEPVAAWCICTSGTPAPTGEMDAESGRPIFGYPNGSPEEVDWLGQKHQIDAVKSLFGMETHVVLCSTMGGTDPSNNLNSLGRTENEDGSESGGNIVKWKRKAEVYLIDSGLPYTIVHPGGLQNEPGGEREIVVGVDDSQAGSESRSIPRDDVAEVMLQSLRHNAAFMNRSFDIRAKPVGGGTPQKEFSDFLSPLEGRNCDYSLGETA